MIEKKKKKNMIEKRENNRGEKIKKRSKHAVRK